MLTARSLLLLGLDGVPPSLDLLFLVVTFPSEHDRQTDPRDTSCF